MPTLSLSTAYGKHFDALESVLRTVGDEKLHSLRKSAIERFEAQGFPTTREEEWKYTDLRHLEALAVKEAYGVNLYREDIKKYPLANLEELVTLTFVNGQFAPELSSEATLPAGCLFGTLEQAYEAIPQVIGQHLAKLAGDRTGKLGADFESRFIDLNTAFIYDAAVLYVPKNQVVEQALHVQWISDARESVFASHPRLLVVLEESAEAKLVESFVGEGTYFTNSVAEITVGQNAKFEHCRVQTESKTAYHICHLQATQASDSVFTSHNISMGALLTRNDLSGWVGGENTETWLNGAYVGKGQQHIDNHTRLDHALPNCNSFEVYKGVLDDEAQGVFNGKIFVYQDAQKTDAKQTNQALLLSNKSGINTKPQLEIFADDVKCTHGATVGQLREDALFYLRARGIPMKQAEALLVYAFVAEVLEKISIEPVRDTLEEMLYAYLGSSMTP